jgi:Tfp pilus assembly protein PilN
MIQQVNLYQDVLKPQRVALPALTIGWLVLGVLVLLLMLFGLNRWQLADARERLALIEAEVATATEELTAISAVAERGPDVALAARVDQARREVEAKRRLLGLLSGGGPSNLDGFSPYLSALGRRHIDGLWLRRILIADGGTELLLEGSTTDERHVPAYLQALAAESVYAGREFHAFRLTRAAVTESQLDFTIVTQCTDRDGIELAPELCASQAERR